jgi:hypothetical protein
VSSGCARDFPRNVFRPGDMFGEYEALYTPVHIFSCIVAEPCEVYVLKKAVRAGSFPPVAC